ncbi:MAG: hypothetical protein EI684_23505 [Candidatus Viridilinea halotolerans]|uniref:Integrase n=1 Tax=Candidatus Viridilinea halotolerans TaxID=2491704 RepID=A0A426TQ60_9CHLR|nr:MAG: hypothetical protein EI684_23505 [Candidatus Viridilinea halotolerans]
MPTITDLMDAFKRDRRGQGKQASGVQRYEACLKRFEVWLRNNGSADVAEISDMSVMEFRDYCIEDRGNKSSTVEKHLVSIRAFALWAIRHNHMTSDPTAHIAWPKRRRPAPKPLNPAELVHLWKILADEPEDVHALWRHRRNRLVIHLMYYAGLRRAEVGRLRVSDISLVGGLIYVRESKGDDRAVAIHKDLLPVLAEACAGKLQTDTVVASEKKKAMSSADVGKIFDGWLLRRGLRISAHRLRHTFATQVYRNSRDLLALQHALGHKSADTTKIYTQIDVEDQRSAISHLSPLCNWTNPV